MSYSSTISELLRYTTAFMRYKDIRGFNFLEEGLGIERRYKRCELYWNEHIERCKSSQRAVFSHLSPERDSLCVYGAGRLYDLDIPFLLSRVASLTLTDADPLCLTFWRKALKNFSQKQTALRIEEATGLFDAACSEIRQLVQESYRANPRHWIDRAEQSVIHFLKEYSPEPSSDITKQTASAVLSANMLGQLPFYWAEAIKKTMRISFPFRTYESLNPDLEDTLYDSAIHLIRNHLNRLASNQPNSILIVTDRSVATYVGWSSYKANVVTEPPIVFDGTTWVKNPTYEDRLFSNFRAEISDPLCGIDITQKETCSQFFPDYDMTYLDTWLWHLAPLGLENKTYGNLHAISAIGLQKKVQ